MIPSDITGTVGQTLVVELARLARGLPGARDCKTRNAKSCRKREGPRRFGDDRRCGKKGTFAAGDDTRRTDGGNTGIGLAFAAAVRGYRLILTMPETMSTERVALLRHLGAEVILTPGILMTAAVERARQLVREIPQALMLDQFGNPANPEVHRCTTALEIWEQTQGAIDILVSAVGTGGTITGVGEVLKQRKTDAHVVAVEPRGAAVLSGGAAGKHSMPGIGVGFIPQVLNREIIDEVIVVEDEEAFAAARRLAREEGILAGISSGAAVHAALTVAK
jgi:cysteine synthase